MDNTHRPNPDTDSVARKRRSYEVARTISTMGGPVCWSGVTRREIHAGGVTIPARMIVGFVSVTNAGFRGQEVAVMLNDGEVVHGISAGDFMLLEHCDA